jgi:nucleotide-binding universal stress UspA family protein
MYKKILTPLDGSKLAEQILPYVRLLAEKYAIPVELLRVDESATPSTQAARYLAMIAERDFPAPKRAEQIVERGNPAEVIVERGSRDPATLIAMATHGLSGTQRWFLGSVAYKVLHRGRNPLLLVRPVEQGATTDAAVIKTLIVPLDGSGLAEKILPHVAFLAKKLNLEVQLMRAYDAPAQSHLVGDGLVLDVLKQIRQGVQKSVDEYLRGKSEELQAQGVERAIAVGVEGDAAGQIIDIGRKTENNLIAMSTHGRSGLGRWVLGSVTERVVHHSRDPVLVIRPE